MKFQGKELLTLLECIHLKGLIEECLLVIKNETGTVEAIDMGNSMYVYSTGPVPGLEDMVVGIPNLGVLCNFLETAAEETITCTIKDRRFKLRRKSRGSVELTLMEKDMVPTSVKQKGSKEKLESNTKYKHHLTKRFCEDFLYYASLIGSKGVLWQISGGKISVGSKKEDNQRFFLPAGSVSSKEEFSIEVYTQYLVPIFRYLIKEIEKEKLSVLRMGSDSPLVITVADNVLWALTPVAI